MAERIEIISKYPGPVMVGGFLWAPGLQQLRPEEWAIVQDKMPELDPNLVLVDPATDPATPLPPEAGESVARAPSVDSTIEDAGATAASPLPAPVREPSAARSPADSAPAARPTANRAPHARQKTTTAPRRRRAAATREK